MKQSPVSVYRIIITNIPLAGVLRYSAGIGLVVTGIATAEHCGWSDCDSHLLDRSGHSTALFILHKSLRRFVRSVAVFDDECEKPRSRFFLLFQPHSRSGTFRKSLFEPGNSRLSDRLLNSQEDRHDNAPSGGRGLSTNSKRSRIQITSSRLLKLTKPAATVLQSPVKLNSTRSLDLM